MNDKKIDYTTPDLANAQLMRVHACYTNTDLTEGRGRMVAFAWSVSPAAAKRIAKGKGVQGSDAIVEAVFAIKIGNVIYAPVQLTDPDPSDSVKDKWNDDRDKVVAKARAAGLSDADIELLVKPPL